MPDPYSLPRMLEELDVPGELDPATTAGMQWTWANPEPFHRLLFAWDQETSAPSKGHPFAQYDLYHDLVFRHRGAGRVALREWTEGGRWQELSYSELHRHSSALAATWKRRGAGPGSAAVMLAPMGASFILGLVTALRLGMCVTCLPMMGPRALAARVAPLGVGFVITDRSASFAASPELQHLLIEELPRVALDDGTGSHTYRDAEVAFRLYSPLRQRPGAPVPLTAGDAHRRALCDAIVLHRIAPGDRVAAPGLDPLQHQPALTLATLIRGGTFVHVPMEALQADGSRLFERPLASLGVGRELRDLCLPARAWRPQVRAWYRDPSQVHDWREWRAFAQLPGLKGVPVTNVIMEAASGGALLTSARRPGGIGQLVLPAAGRPWALGDLLFSGQAAIPSYGLFAPQGPGLEGLNPMVLVRYGEELFFGDRARPAKEGRVWPAVEVIAEVEAMAQVEGASAHTIVAGESGGRYANALVVFTGARRVDPGALAEEIRRRLRVGYGPDWVPDHITVAPFLPRRVEGKVDAEWSEGQLLTGLLHQKARLRTFQLLTALKDAVRRQPAAGGAR